MSLRRLAVTGGGLGFMRPAPGTWGSLPPIAVVLAILACGGAAGAVHVALAITALLASSACVAWGRWAEEAFGSKDPGTVVADEVAGQCIALVALPWVPMTDASALRTDLLLAGGAFVAFRILDIVKPPPARGLQKMAGGWGILVDDLVAGGYACLLMQLAVRVMA